MVTPLSACKKLHFHLEKTSENLEFLHPKFAPKSSWKCQPLDMLKAHKLESECTSIMLLACKYCGVQRFKTQLGLNQHVKRNLECAAKASSALAANGAPVRLAPAEDLVYVPREIAAQGSQDLVVLQMEWVHLEDNHRPRSSRDAPNLNGSDLDIGLVNQAADDLARGEAEDDVTDPGMPQLRDDSNDIDMESLDGFDAFDDDDDDEDEDEADPIYDDLTQYPLGVAKYYQQEFRKYTANAKQHYIGFDRKEVLAVKLLDALRRKRATMDTYEAVLQPVYEHYGTLHEGQHLGETPQYVSRDRLMRKLALRYNMYPQQNLQEEREQKQQGKKKLQHAKLYLQKTMVLPFSKAAVDVIYFDFRQQLVNLLTDPRLTDEDFLHFNDDPFADLPDLVEYPMLGDVNTGDAYRETHKRLITKPGEQMLLPIIFYIDATATGQMVALKVEAMKFTVGILNRKARGKKCAWRTIGYVPTYLKEISRGKKMFVETGHDATAFHDVEEGEGENAAKTKEAFNKAADWQAILSVILQSYRDFETNGFVFDYRFGGKTHKNIEFVPFVLFVKSDTEEADKLCGKFLSRTGNVKQLCRYCDIPNALTGRCLVKFNFKNEPEIRRLCMRNEVEKLRDMSQHHMTYAFHGFRFGLHNNRGIHGGTPIDMLHMVLLGIFKYVKTEFFQQLGPGSLAATEINALCTWIGKLLARQSDRDLPRTQFGQGIVKGKLMGKEMTGVLLLMAAVLQTSKGKQLLRSSKGSTFKSDVVYRDWVLLLETLLQWEMFMRQEEIHRKHVKRLEKKHQYLLFLIKKVIKRTKGMGTNLVKFHAILHLFADILMFGVALNVDTSENEEHWKPTKVAAKLTQKDMRSFVKQTATRLVEFDLLDLAMEELKGNKIWEYFQREAKYVQTDQDGLEVNLPRKERIATQGTPIDVYWDGNAGRAAWRFASSRAANQEKVQWDQDLVEYLFNLQDNVFHSKLDILTEHYRKGQFFRAHPNYRQGGSWNDWVLFDWGNGDKIPAQIWCFIDLTFLPDGFRRNIDTITVQKGVYAVVESAEYDVEDNDSELFLPCIKTYKQVNQDGSIRQRQFYLAETEAFMEPISVFADIGHANKRRYLQIVPRNKWARIFEKWVQAPHTLDEIEEDPLPQETSSDEDDSSEEESASEESSDAEESE